MEIINLWTIEIRHPNSFNLLDFRAFDNEKEAYGAVMESLSPFLLDIKRNGILKAVAGYDPEKIENFKEYGIRILDEQQFLCLK